MNIAVYCGSRSGDDPEYEQAARALGTWIGRNGHTLVYGAGFKGMMGAVSGAVQAAGGSIIGVIPQFMVDAGWQKPDLTLIRAEELVKGRPSSESGTGGDAGRRDVMLITDSMSTRKAKMLELADVYVALPGGPGTLEEITEAISLSCVEQHDRLCVLLNLKGYYEPLRRMYGDMVAGGFTERKALERVRYAGSTEELTGILGGLCAAQTACKTIE